MHESRSPSPLPLSEVLDLADAALGRIPVVLPVPIYVHEGESISLVYVRPLDGKMHLFAGLMPLIIADRTAIKKKSVRAKKKVDDIEETIDRVVLACLTAPITATLGTPSKTCIHVKDIAFESRAAIYEAAATAALSLFFGTDRNMAGSKDDKLKADQAAVARFFYRCCSELGDSMSNLEHMDESELTRRLSVLQAGDAMKSRAAAEARRKIRGGNG